MTFIRRADRPGGAGWSASRWFGAAGLVFALLGAGCGVVGCAPKPATPLRVAIHPWPGYETLHLAQSLGYLCPAEVRLVELTSASQSVLAMRNGTVGAALLTLDEALVLRQDGVDLRVVLVMDVSDGADVVMARPAIATLWDLRGKRIGVELGAVGAVVLDALLTAGGLTVSDVQLLPLPLSEHAAAYREGRVDAVVTFEPVRSVLLAEGAQVLYDSSRIPDRIIDVLAVRADALPRHEYELSALVAAHFQALQFLSQQPAAAAERLAPFFGVRPEQVPPHFTGLKLTDLATNRAFLSGPAPRLAGKTAELRDVMLNHGLLRRAVALEQLIEPRFLPSPVR